MNVITQNSSATSPNLDIFNPKVLFVLPKSSTGTAISGSLYRDIKTRDEATALFGAGSPMNDAIQTYFDQISLNGRSRKIGRFSTKINAIGYEVTGTVGVQNIALTGTPLDGEIELYFNSSQKNTIKIKTLSTDTLAGVATKIANALNGFSYAPFVATTSTANVILTASMAGEWFNNLPFLVLLNTSGLTLTKTTTTAGVGTMDLSGLINEMKPYRFDYIHIPFTQLTTAISEFIEGRVTFVKNKALGGLCYISKFNQTIAEHADNIDDYKSKVGLCYIVQKKTQEQETEYNICAKAMLARAVKTAEMLISDYVAKAEENNGIGGQQYKIQQMTGSLLPNTRVYNKAQQWTAEELEQLDALGCVYFRNNDSDTGVIFGREFTTYSITLDGETPNIRSVAEWDAVCGSQFVTERLVTDFTGSTLQRGNIIVSNSTQISEENIKATLESYFVMLGSKDFENNIVFGWCANDAVSLANFRNEVNITFQINYIEGTITTSQITTLLGAFNQIFINNIFTK